MRWSLAALRTMKEEVAEVEVLVASAASSFFQRVMSGGRVAAKEDAEESAVLIRTPSANWATPLRMRTHSGLWLIGSSMLVMLPRIAGEQPWGLLQNFQISAWMR